MFFRYVTSLSIGALSPNSDFNVKLFTFSKFSLLAFYRSTHWIKKWGTVSTARLQIGHPNGDSWIELFIRYPWVTSICPTLRRLIITLDRRGMLIFVNGRGCSLICLSWWRIVDTHRPTRHRSFLSTSNTSLYSLFECILAGVAWLISRLQRLVCFHQYPVTRYPHKFHTCVVDKDVVDDML